jgi:hypothetical protein
MFTFYFDGCQAELAEAVFIHDSPFGIPIAIGTG